MKTPTKISNKKEITTALFNLLGAGFTNRITDLKIISKKGTFTDIGITCVLHGSDAVLTAKEICG